MATSDKSLRTMVRSWMLCKTMTSGLDRGPLIGLDKDSSGCSGLIVEMKWRLKAEIGVLTVEFPD